MRESIVLGTLLVIIILVVLVTLMYLDMVVGV